MTEQQMTVPEALDVLRNNIRDEDGDVLRTGIRDNDKTRRAMAAILDSATLSHAEGEGSRRKIAMEQAHMAGQEDAGIDPSYISARAYADEHRLERYDQGVTAKITVDEERAWADALEATAPQVAVPEGWKLVPVEPTQEMMMAFEGWREYDIADHWGDEIRRPYGSWRAMLAAAPTAPAPDEREAGQVVPAKEPLHEIADALDCFWNVAIGAAPGNETVGAIGQGFMAVADRLREHELARLRAGKEGE